MLVTQGLWRHWRLLRILTTGHPHPHQTGRSNARRTTIALRLLKAGATPRVGPDGAMPLHHAAMSAHAPLVAGSDIRKGDRVAARVAYGSVQINDLGTVVGSGDHKSQRVCVVWDRDGAKSNWLPGAQLAVVDDAPPLSEGTP